MDSEQPNPLFRPTDGGYRWDGVPYQPYKQDGSAPFKDISRQTLFHDPSLGCELRYFEMDAAGYSTLERHEHTHAVMIFRGSGKLIGLLPSDKPRVWDDTLDLSGVKAGTYKLAVRVPNPLKNGHPLKFANKTQDADTSSWLTLGSVEVK